MEKKSNITIKSIVAIGIGAALFFVAGRFIALPSPVPNTTMNIQYGILSVFSIIFGPFVGVLAGFIGHTLIDLTWGSPWWSWIIASAVFGLIMGLVKKKIDIENGVFGKKEIILFAVIWMAIMQGILYGALLPAFRKVSKYVRHGWGKYYAVVLTFWALVVAQSLPAIMQPVDKKAIMVFMLTLLAYCITYVVLFASMKSMEILSQEKQKSLHSELLQAQVDAQANEAALVRQNRHDMRFHYQTLLSMANAGELDNIIAYVKQQSESIETMTTGRFCENETINNILRVYYEKAVQSQIQITIRAAVKPQINVPSPALVTIVANILENALHGTQESKVMDPSISVSIKHKAGRLVISCRNNCKSSLVFLEMPDQLQGVGIHSVISTAEKYNGSCRFSAADGIFSAVVIIDE